MTSIIVSDEYVNELFEGTNFGEVINNDVTEKRKQLHKTLTAVAKGSWSGHTAYHIVLDGGFIKDGKTGEPKELTALGNAFMSQFEDLSMRDSKPALGVDCVVWLEENDKPSIDRLTDQNHYEPYWEESMYSFGDESRFMILPG